MSGFLRSFKRFDVYRDIPKEYTEQTTTGAAVSLMCSLAIVYLFFAEFLDFMAVSTTSSVSVCLPNVSANVVLLSAVLLCGW